MLWCVSVLPSCMGLRDGHKVKLSDILYCFLVWCLCARVVCETQTFWTDIAASVVPFCQHLGWVQYCAKVLHQPSSFKNVLP